MPESIDKITQLFNWRTRIMVGAHEAGETGIETLASHSSDENAHPQYLKKGQAVPTGQEYTLVGRHNSYLLAHMRTLARRDELIRTKDEYDAVKNDAPYVDNANNYSKTAPSRHIVTARALRDILEDYLPKDALIKNVGDGTNLIYIDEKGTGRVSDKTIGTNKRPVYLRDGRLEPIAHDAVLVDGNQTISGRKTFNIVPNVSVDAALPSAETDLVTVAYLKNASRLPVGFNVITATTFDTPEKVATALGYGTWKMSGIVGNFGYMWLRTA